MVWDLNTSKYKWLGVWGVHTQRPNIAHTAVRGIDFDCLPHSFLSVVYAAARTRGLKATAKVIGNTVVYTFYKPDGFTKPNLDAYDVVKRAKGQ